MKTGLYLIALAVLGASASPLAAAQLNSHSSLADAVPNTMVGQPAASFDPIIEDLPLMPGMHPLPNEAAFYITPHAGRTIDTEVEGTVDIDDMYAFYAQNLPRLGWQRIATHTYRRDKDVLKLTGHADGKLTTVRFSITTDS